MSIIKKGNVTLSALMLFCKYTQVFFPQLCITAVVVSGTEIGELGAQGERFIDNRRIEGCLPEIFDEIQACPRAIPSLKYFCENMPELHLVAAGSLLGVALKHEGISFPVGKVDRLEMFPMSFSEFVTADGGENLIKRLYNMPLERELPALYTIPLEKYLKNYYIVGGMPEAVGAWIETHNYQDVEMIQDRILTDYSDDFGKYASYTEANQTKQIWDSIPTQIAKENNKFVFSHLNCQVKCNEVE